MMKRLATAATLAALVLAPLPALAQSAQPAQPTPSGAGQPGDHLAQGDRAHAARDVAAALRHYEAALAADPKSYEAAWKASGAAIELGEFNEDAAERSDLYARAERYARQAVSANPGDAEGHFSLARAIGRNALTMGTRDRVKFANEVRKEALAALETNPKHPGALHVLGMWNAEIMRLSGPARFFAKNLLGGKTFGEASWDGARRYMEEAVAVEPDRITHRLDLAGVYADIGETAKAREQLEWIARATPKDYNDANYKRVAAERLAKLK